jgi:3-carboxy-cis,cis-muconate cycloisomerase
VPLSLAQSQIYGQLFGDPEIEALFSDSAEMAAMLKVEAALAQVQANLGLIPAEAAGFIAQATATLPLDPAALASETARNGVPVPALLAALRATAQAPAQMHYLHWGATSQDIMDTGLALRLRPLLALWESRIQAVLARLAQLAEAHAELPMAARTYGQIATPTSFGAVAAGWGWPLIAARTRLAELRPLVLQVSLSGAAGTLAAMGPRGPEVRAGLAATLDLADPDHSWHADRSGITALAGFAASLAGSLGKLGEDLILLSQSGLAEVSLGGGGSSSTMPQKQNPVAASALVALARMVIGQAAILQGAGLHRQQRDGAAWFTEWLTLPQCCAGLGRMLGLAQDCLNALRPEPEAMQAQMETSQGSLMAEALTFALARQMPRPQAEAQVKALLAKAAAQRQSLATLACAETPSLDWAAIKAASLGQAPAEARRFAQRLAQTG